MQQDPKENYDNSFIEIKKEIVKQRRSFATNLFGNTIKFFLLFLIGIAVIIAFIFLYINHFN